MHCECGKKLTTVHTQLFTYMFCTKCEHKERVFIEIDEDERYNILSRYFRGKHEQGSEG